MATLAEIIRPLRERVAPSGYPNLPFIGMEHVEAHTLRLLGTVPASAMRSSAVHFRPDNVLYGRLRPYLNKVYRPDFEGLCSAEFIVFDCGRHLEAKYIQFFLNGAEFVSFASHLKAGERPRVDFEQLAGYPLPLPPLAEQRRIVAEIEKQFTRLEAAEAALLRLKANLKRYRAAVLKAACEGRSFVPFGTVISFIKGGTTAVPVDETTGFPVLRSSSVRGMSLDLSDVRFLKREDALGCEPFLQDGDLVITRLSGSPQFVGNCALVAGIGHRRVAYPDRLFCVRTTGDVEPRFVPIAFAATFVRKQIDQRLKSSAGHQRISISDITEILFPLPALAEQHRIVAEVERRLSVVEQLDATIEANLKRAARLRQAILKRAFEGRLVPQDPNDEPASVLLERVRAQRAEGQGSGQPRRRTRKDVS